MKFIDTRKFIAAVSAVAMAIGMTASFSIAAAAPIDVAACISSTTGAGTAVISGKNVAYTTANNGVWYLGRYDVSSIDSITAYAALCPDGSANAPTLKIGYMPAAENVTNTYIDSNNGTIRSASHLLYSYEGTTTDETTVVSSYDKFDTVTFSASGVQTSDEVDLFLYATAQGKRAYIDYITITETSAVPVDPSATQAPTVAVIGETEYSDLKTALESAQDGDVVDVIQSVTLTARAHISNSITVTTSNGSTITTADTTPGGILIKSGISVLFDGIDITAGGSNPAIAISCQPDAGTNVTIKDATVTGGIYHENGLHGAIALDNASAGDVHTRHSVGGNSASCSIVLENGSIADSITYSSEDVSNYPADSVSVDGSSSGGNINDIAVRYFTVTGDTDYSYDTIKIRSTDGIARTPLSATITGYNVSIAIQFINIPYNVEINSVTLE